jgi:predicted regulator of Ras-like GTPase activity (Roadblock/LC7/MglB family)
VNSFAGILQRMVERVPGATGAIFADWEGEPVGEFAPEMPALEIQIFGAQWGVVWAELQRALARAQLGRARELIIDGEHGSVLVRQVTDEYYVVLAVGRDGHLAKALDELSRGVEALRAEM